MNGPLRLIRSEEISGLKNLGPLFEWAEGRAYLAIDRVTFNGEPGAILCYYNPPVHQVGTPGLLAYLEGLDAVIDSLEELKFIVLSGANDPVHSGGDIKESLNKLKETLKAKEQMEPEGAPEKEIDRLFSWGEERIRKGVDLYRKIRSISREIRIIGLCGGGTRYGGSAEIPLMCDYLVADSRSGICFSEVLIGIIPGWAGIARVLTKAGLPNGECMSKTAREVNSNDLKRVGIYNEVVNVPYPFPKRTRTDDPDSDKRQYVEALQHHEDSTGRILLPKALQVATCPVGEIPKGDHTGTNVLAAKEDVDLEVQRRSNPDNYSHIWGKPLGEVRGEIDKLGRPLAPQSIEALNELFDSYEESEFNEGLFVEQEMEADARLYRDPRFMEGLTAMLEQRVPDFRPHTD